MLRRLVSAALSAGTLAVAMPAAHAGERIVACWERESLKLLANAYEKVGEPGVLIVFGVLKAKQACWLPQAGERQAQRIVGARDETFRDPKTGEQAVVMLRRYPFAPRQGQPFYLASAQ